MSTTDYSRTAVDPSLRCWDRHRSVVFLKTREEFGGLSNMAAGYPLRVNGLEIRTAEALYQACRFPHLPEVQLLIISQKSPMTAKMKSKPHRADSRPDWEHQRVTIMRWSLRMKLVQNWSRFRELLLSTGSRPIVEESRRDSFWGAKPDGARSLVGANVLGRLLMELRDEVATAPESLFEIHPPAIPRFWIAGRPVAPIARTRAAEDGASGSPVLVSPHVQGTLLSPVSNDPHGGPEVRRGPWAEQDAYEPGSGLNP